MNKRIPIILGLAIVGTLVYFRVYRTRDAGGDFLASGTVEATEAALGFQVPGRIARIGPHEGDQVKAGDELAVLDRAELEARRTQAQWQLAAARSLLAEIEAGSRTEELMQARGAAGLASDRVADAQRDFDRAQRLLQGGAISQEAFDKAKLALDVAKSQRDQVGEQLKLVEKGPRAERREAQRAVVSQGEAALRVADAGLANAAIKAPFAGVVAVRDREPGETVAAGAPVLTIVDLNDRWIRIYIREDQIGAVRLGQAATITSDTYPAKTYTGAVSFIASQAEFTPRNVQTTEERVKLVYAVKVRITGDAAIDLKPGMPADVKIATTAN
jgi:HlyD family secretion protein